MSAGLGVLDEILARTRESVEQRRKALPLDRLARSAPTPTGRRAFIPAVSRAGMLNVIAEFKRRSPSRGAIREDLHPVNVAQAYEIAGAAAMSILTEPHYFGGSIDDLREARAATLLPTLRKDFVIDPYQVWEAWYAGADAVLLIVAALPGAALGELHATVGDLGLAALVEVHDREELGRALDVGARLIGVNNRDLRSMQVRLETALELAPFIPDDVVAVAESGIQEGADVRRLHEAGYDAFLVGEHLMRGAAGDPGAALERLLSDASARGAARGRRRSVGVAVKICGITSVEDGLAAVRAGADAVGFVFWPGSPRRVEIEAARRIAQALPPFVTRVGVFVDADPGELTRVADRVGLDLLQLHGDEPPQLFAELPRRALKAVRVGPDFGAGQALRYEGRAAGLLLDTRLTGADAAPGGTGRAFDWSLARDVRQGASYVVLAGGLHPGNVREAMAAVRPDAVDVSSGVEDAPGRKSFEKMRAFVAAVREAER